MQSPRNVDLLPLVPMAEASRRARAVGAPFVSGARKTASRSATWNVQTWSDEVAFSPDGSRILISAWGTISYGQISRLWDVSNGTEIARSWRSQERHAWRHVQSRRPPLATVSVDGSARLWDGVTGELRDVLGEESAG